MVKKMIDESGFRFNDHINRLVAEDIVCDDCLKVRHAIKTIQGKYDI